MKQIILTVFKMGFGLFAVGVVALEAVALNNIGQFVPSYFFSYLTILSNLFAGSLMILSALIGFSHWKHSLVLVYLRGVATVLMVMTGLMFHLLFSNAESTTAILPWSSDVLHYLMPTVVVFDWLLERSKATLRFNLALTWFFVPLIYLGVIIIRGLIANWYPYPFLYAFQTGQSIDSVVLLLCVLAALTFVIIVMIWGARSFISDRRFNHTQSRVS